MAVSSGVNEGDYIRDRIRQLYQRELYTDVEFRVKSDGVHKGCYPAHKAILAVGSPVFAAMLFTEPRPDDTRPTIVQIGDVSYAAFGNVLQFLYTDEVDFEDDQEAIETAKAADKFILPSLKAECIIYLKSVALKTESVVQVLEVAIQLKLTELVDRCLCLIGDQTSDIIRLPNFQHVKVATFKKIVTLHKLALRSESELFDIVVSWAARQCSKPEMLRTTVEPLLRHIRFLSMTAAEFSACVERYRMIFTDSEALAIMMRKSNPNSQVDFVPKWCNKCSDKRCFLTTTGKKKPENVWDRTLAIPLKIPAKDVVVTSLSSIVELKNFNHPVALTGMKLQFRVDHRYKSSSLDCFVIVSVPESGFQRSEDIGQVSNNDQIMVRLGKNVLIDVNQSVVITVEVTNIQSYNFYEYDFRRADMDQKVPFHVALECKPSRYSFFLVSEVYFEENTRVDTRRGKIAKNRLKSSSKLNFGKM